MAFSNPTATEAAPAIAPRFETLATIAEQVAALDQLIGLARRSIRVFDVDLSTMGWNSPQRSDALTRFLRASRQAKLDIVVHDTRYIESRCARLLRLQRIFGEAVTIHRSGSIARGAMDPLVIVDGIHFLHRFHADEPRAALGIAQPQAARPLVERFNEIWASSESGVTGTTLGL
jgi:hypothetical protein